MRTLVDIPEADVRALEDLGRQRRVSRAKIIRQALREFLVKNGRAELDEAFGLWSDHAEDGLEYQRRIRSEW